MRDSNSESDSPSSAACSCICRTRKSLASRTRMRWILGRADGCNNSILRERTVYNDSWRAGRAIAGCGRWSGEINSPLQTSEREESPDTVLRHVDHSRSSLLAAAKRTFLMVTAERSTELLIGQR